MKFLKCWRLTWKRWEKDGIEKRGVREALSLIQGWASSVSISDNRLWNCLWATVIKRLKWVQYSRELICMDVSRQAGAFSLLGAQLELSMSVCTFSMWLAFHSMMSGFTRGGPWVLALRTSVSKSSGGSLKTSYGLELEMPKYHFQNILLTEQVTESHLRFRERNWTPSQNKMCNKEFVTILNQQQI